MRQVQNAARAAGLERRVAAFRIARVALDHRQSERPGVDVQVRVVDVRQAGEARRAAVDGQSAAGQRLELTGVEGAGAVEGHAAIAQTCQLPHEHAAAAGGLDEERAARIGGPAAQVDLSAPLGDDVRGAVVPCPSDQGGETGQVQHAVRAAGLEGGTRVARRTGIARDQRQVQRAGVDVQARVIDIRQAGETRRAAVDREDTAGH